MAIRQKNARRNITNFPNLLPMQHSAAFSSRPGVALANLDPSLRRSISWHGSKKWFYGLGLRRWWLLTSFPLEMPRWCSSFRQLGPDLFQDFSDGTPQQII